LITHFLQKKMRAGSYLPKLELQDIKGNGYGFGAECSSYLQESKDIKKKYNEGELESHQNSGILQ
jgi:hypothetical protein